ncbi:DUF1192 domain-containing protein [Altererythrobacter aquiaggeris]|uniref:DUF1192 domain-containing protein n=1 Tax=Aestuarierythrobacter aquiaggeris TaxID=1898396 RepID=UPI0030174EC8
MEDDRPRAKGDAAGKLSGELLDSYSLHELDERIISLEAEIARVRAHREKSASHRSAADALFGGKP